MKKRKQLIRRLCLALIVVLTLSFLGCQKESNEIDSSFLESFFENLYQKQIDYKTELVDALKSENDWNEVAGFKWLTDFLTKECAEELVLKRYYPSEMTGGFDQFQITQFKTKKQKYESFDEWNVSYTVVFFQNEEEIKSQNMDIVLDTNKEKTKISALVFVDTNDDSL